MYLFGVREPGSYGAINAQTGETILFMPRLEAVYATWMGRLLTCDEFRERYGVEHVRYVDEVKTMK